MLFPISPSPTGLSEIQPLPLRRTDGHAHPENQLAPFPCPVAGSLVLLLECAMEASLLAELHHKLSELDRKVQHYRQDRLADFQQTYHQLLGHIDPSVTSAVNHALQPSLPDYHYLRPELPETPLPLSRVSSVAPAAASNATFQPSSPAAASHPTETRPTSSHAREVEFQGLFTPSYLPLLESSRPLSKRSSLNSDLSSPSSDETATGAVAASPQERRQQPHQAVPGRGSSNSTTMMSRTSESEESPGDQESLLSIRPHHERRSTDDTTSSTLSEKSSGTARRSALRRSSSASKTPQSPRRVRFEFMGAEVLPTASPQHSEMATPRPSSPVPGGDRSMLDDDEDNEPPPRKISSSEALRALSRAPLEGTVWTVVNPDSDDASSEQTNSRPTTPLSPAKAQFMPAKGDAMSSAASAPETPPGDAKLGSVDEETEDDIDNDDDSSEEEFLAMAKPKSFSNKKAIRSPAPGAGDSSSDQTPASGPEPAGAPSHSRAGKSSITPTQKTETSELESHVEHEDPFHFEMGGLSAPPRPRQSPQPRSVSPSTTGTGGDDEDHDDDDDDGEISAKGPQLSSSATSAAVSIAKPKAPSGPPTPTTAKFQIGSVGSYKGKPIVMPVVRNPELHAQAESLGDFNTFVGGLDGSSGMDEGDLNSFRASIMPGGFSGTPRSLTERFMMEEMQAERKRRGEAS